ncbi:MAG: hypothetical protein PHW00_06375 [Clostridia bacterium]|nr:hypothetical protein [Clostridia bacterium]
MRLALIGSQVVSSYSPQLMRFFADKSSYELTYTTVQLDENVDNATLLDTIEQYDGVNITMPFKTRVARLLGINGSVNTIYRQNGKQFACSTDGMGVMLALRHYGIQVFGKNLLVIGAGGASHSAVKSLTEQGANVFVVNRNQHGIDLLKKEFTLLNYECIYDGILSFVPVYDYLFGVNDTQIECADFVLDALYDRPTVLLNTARRHNKTAISGESMLFFQGVCSYYYFTGIKLDNIDALYEEYINEVIDNKRP